MGRRDWPPFPSSPDTEEREQREQNHLKRLEEEIRQCYEKFTFPLTVEQFMSNENDKYSELKLKLDDKNANIIKLKRNKNDKKKLYEIGC